MKIGALALMPAVAAGVLALSLDGSATEAAAGTIPSTSTTTTANGGPELPYNPEDYELDDLSQPETDALEVPDVPADGATEPDAPDEPEAPSDDGEEDPPAAALMALPGEVEADGQGKATIEISNLGELALEVYLVDVNDNPIEVADVATEVGAYSSEDINVTVDTSDLPFGDYEMTVSVSTNDGVGHVIVKGSKLLVFIPMLPDLDISDAYVLPHQANLLELAIVNNEAHNVTIGLNSDDDRLTFPAEVELVPGENEVVVVVQALAVPWNVIDILELTVTYGVVELETVTITKHGS
jgi:hypothetical protein